MSLLVLREVTRTVALPDGSDLRILRGVDLDVEPGDHLAIVGRSGTGKSTLLNILGLLDAPTSGWYFIDGAAVARMPASRRAALRGDTFGFVFQQFNLLPGRTALENVMAPLLYARGHQFWKRADIAAQMLDRVGLGDRLDDDPITLSGGEQQRVAIARSLVRSPRVILADEPTGALDVETGGQVIDLLEEIAAATGAVLITITHDLAVAARAATAYRLGDGVLRPVTIDRPGALRLGGPPGATAADPDTTGLTATGDGPLFVEPGAGADDGADVVRTSVLPAPPAPAPLDDELFGSPDARRGTDEDEEVPR